MIFSRVGVYIRVPGVDVDRFADSMRSGGGGLLGYIDQLSGGSISKVGLFSLGEPTGSQIQDEQCSTAVELDTAQGRCRHRLLRLPQLTLGAMNASPRPRRPQAAINTEFTCEKSAMLQV